MLMLKNEMILSDSEREIIEIDKNKFYMDYIKYIDERIDERINEINDESDELDELSDRLDDKRELIHNMKLSIVAFRELKSEYIKLFIEKVNQKC